MLRISTKIPMFVNVYLALRCHIEILENIPKLITCRYTVYRREERKLFKYNIEKDEALNS